MAPRDDARSEPEMDRARLAKLLKPMASPVRLRIMDFLMEPHYVEEIGRHLGLSRQATRKHLKALEEIEAVTRHARSGERGAVIEYTSNPQALFLACVELERLGSRPPKNRTDAFFRTAIGPQGGSPRPIEVPCVSIVRGFNVGRRLVLDSARRNWTIGREPECQLPLEHDPFVSNRHVEIYRETGSFFLQDLASRNGTEVNWTQVPRNASTRLQQGALIGIGRSLLLFWDSDPGRGTGASPRS